MCAWLNDLTFRFNDSGDGPRASARERESSVWWTKFLPFYNEICYDLSLLLLRSSAMFLTRRASNSSFNGVKPADLGPAHSGSESCNSAPTSPFTFSFQERELDNHL